MAPSRSLGAATVRGKAQKARSPDEERSTGAVDGEIRAWGHGLRGSRPRSTRPYVRFGPVGERREAACPHSRSRPQAPPGANGRGA